MWVEATPGLSLRFWAPDLSCSICGSPIRSWHAFNYDHKVPLSRGGRPGKINKRLAHLLCNSVKGDRHPFSLRTPQEREAVRVYVRPRTYVRLQELWGDSSG